MNISEFVRQLLFTPQKKDLSTDLNHRVTASPLPLTALLASARGTWYRRQNVLGQDLPLGSPQQFFKSVKEDISPPSSFSHHLSSAPSAVAVVPIDVRNRNKDLLPRDLKCLVGHSFLQSKLWDAEKESISCNLFCLLQKLSYALRLENLK